MNFSNPEGYSDLSAPTSSGLRAPFPEGEGKRNRVLGDRGIQGHKPVNKSMHAGIAHLC